MIIFCYSRKKYVLDEGSLLHKLKWNTGNTYDQLAFKYAHFTKENNGTTTVLFDDYESGPSIKNCTHKKCERIISQTVIFRENIIFEGAREEILSKAANKKQLINIVTEQFKKQYITATAMRILHR